MWWSDGKEREAEQLEHREERRNGRLKGRKEVAVIVVRPATWGMVSSQPKLQLRAMSEFMAIQQLQGSMLMSMVHITIIEHEDVQELCRTDLIPSPDVALWRACPISPCQQYSGKQALHLTQAS